MLLAVTVGAVVAGAAAFDGAGACSAGVVSGGRSDPECWHLVRLLAERIGMFVAGATAVFALTVVGLSRLVVVADGESGGRPPL